MSTTVEIVAEVYMRDGDGAPEIIATKAFKIDVMKIGTVRQWMTRKFNEYLKAAPKDRLVWAGYTGRMTRSPFNYYSGGLYGVNGSIMKRTGEMDQ